METESLGSVLRNHRVSTALRRTPLFRTHARRQIFRETAASGTIAIKAIISSEADAQSGERSETGVTIVAAIEGDAVRGDYA
jgi:hypothetical protein